jgi:hypothetical protein
MTRGHLAGSIVAAACLLASTVGAADTISKEQCIDAHSRGQDAREQGRISLARKLFLSCAQAACPPLVQGDCARFADDLSRQQSSLTFVARDAQGNDLPDTAVYVDDALVVTRLDDGKPHDVDPGKHTIRFSTGGKDQSVTVVVGTGEKGRSVVATFAAINPIAGGVSRPAAPAAPAEPVVNHPAGARTLIIAGAAATAVGAGLVVFGLHKIPAACSISTSHCTAPPGDPVFDDAKSGAVITDIGLGIGVLGAGALAGGLYWYYSRASTERPGPGDKVVTPMIGSHVAGIAISGPF